MASRAVDHAFEPQAGRHWFSASELAALALPGVAADQRSINRRALEEHWSTRTGPAGGPLARPRTGRGGGLEYHATLLPPQAQLELARRGITCERLAEPAHIPDGSWQWLESQTEEVRAEAQQRLGHVLQIELLEAAGVTRTSAIGAIAARSGVGKSTLWKWLRQVDGVAPENRLPALASRRQGGGREAEIDHAIWVIYKSDVLRLSGASLTSCYERTAAIATERGIPVPCERTFRRRFEREVDPAIATLLRDGEEALRRSIPAQRRTVEHLHAMECVNIDGHRFDVFVTPPGGGEKIRPIMIAIQDIRSSKIVAWRLGETESAALARLTVADMLRDFGIPKRMTTDNGRGFASKWLTGGTSTRFRFKVMDDEPTGLLVALGIDINWALPYRGQSKPIERAFRDLADTIARAPTCEGAYTGPNPQKKPANYGARAVPWFEFEAHVAREVKRHNARLGRRGRDYRGRSFDQVFAETFTEIGKASPEQMRMALLAAEQVLVNRQTSEIELFGNRYWAEGCTQMRGQRVTVRFDPQALHGEVHLYDQRGRFLLTAQLIADTGWGDVQGSKESAKRWAGYRRKIRDGAEAEGLLTAEQLSAMQAGTVEPEIIEPPVVRPARHRGQVAAQLKGQPKPRAAEASQRESRVFAALRLVGGDD